MIAAYPLQWPDIIPRRTTTREAGSFKTSLADALQNVEDSLRKFGTDSGRGVKDIVLSSNYTLGKTRPADPGVAAWFVWDGDQVCIPVDRYATIEANLQAIHHIIEARRVELRHGTLALVRATFRGFKALPNHVNKRSWREILGGQQHWGRTQFETAYRALASANHPDRGGDSKRMAEINDAWAAAQKELDGR